MPSYTSSSNTRLPDAPYGKLWVVTIALFVVALAFFEWFWRQQGHLPSVADSVRFWAMHRADVYDEDGKSVIAIVGASRSQLGIVPSVLESVLPGFRVKHLAIDGTPAFEVVRGLSEDNRFRGVVLWDSDAEALSPAGPGESRQDRLYSSFFEDEFGALGSLDKNLNCWIAASLQTRLVTLSPELTFRELLKARFRPKPSYISMDMDRYRPGRYLEKMTPVEREEHKRKRIERRTSVFRFADIARFDGVAQTDLLLIGQLLRAKGGDLILLQMPTTGEHWAMDSVSAPKGLFWDRIHELSGVQTIHFRDYPELSGFDCPDGSHLDATDAPEFTRRLSLILRRKLEEDGVLRPGKPVSASAHRPLGAAQR